MNQKEVDLLYLRETYKLAMLSPDPSTQNGAIIVRRNDIFDMSPENLIATAYNRFPEGIKATEEMLNDREWKYNNIVHAEDGAILAVARNPNESTVGKIMYAPWYACSDCGKAISVAGLEEVIGYAGPERWWKEQVEKSGGDGAKDWAKSIQYALTMFEKKGLKHRVIDGQIGEVEFLFRGVLRRP
jgi:deoxycytidylate deaminase